MSITHCANYEMSCSIHKLNLDKIKITNQKTENVQISINTLKSNNFEEDWKDGVFLIEFPKEIIALNVEGITVSNSNVKIKNYDVYKENDQFFIKIFTENEEKANFSIDINAKVTANPLETTKTVRINCFGYNPICDNYESKRTDLYDIDNDENRNDLVGISSQNLTLIAPAGLISTEYVTEYDELNNTCIAPNIAEIQKSDEVKNARINISLTNSYSGTISEIMILGKIPFTGNKYTETNEELKSRFNTKLKSAINIPENIMQYVTVYYSEESNPNKDLQDASNGWILEENVSNWENIKSYLIDFGEYKLSRSENEIIYYDVEVPGGLDYNLISFSNHAIYFCLDTPEGKLRSQIETNKVGLQIVEKYNMQITKNRKGLDNTKVGGATYKVVCMDADDKPISKLATSNSDGILQFKDLYLNKEYTLKEVEAPENYSVDKSEIKFIVYKDEQDNMKFETIDSGVAGSNELIGRFKNIPQFTQNENGDYVVLAEIEDEAAYTLNINKKDQEGKNLHNIRFSVKGKNKNSVYRTDEEGKISIKGLYVDEEYQVKEIEADGYYIDEEPRILKISRNNEGILEVQAINGIEDEVFKNASIVENEENPQITVDVNIVNEKIPVYNLQIVKVKENFDEENLDNLEPLKGANFVIYSEDNVKQIERTTNEEGKITINNLYQYVPGKYITGEYKITEVKAPDGFANNAEEISLTVSSNEQGNMQADIKNKDNLKTFKKIIIDDDTNTVILVLQDKPLFELKKIDSRTGEPLANTKFIIYKIDKDGKEIDYAKDINGNYIGNQDENGDYIVVTDEYGKIVLPLEGGIYKAVEVGYPEGYQERNTESIFKVNDGKQEETGEIEENEVIEINYIDDLVHLSQEVQNGDNYAGKIIKLMKNLDFENDADYLDLSLKNNLIKSNGGVGFTPIGINNEKYFSGIFDGQNYEIKNLYINSDNEFVGLFGNVKNTEIKNLSVTGEVTGNNTIETHTSGIIANAYNCYLINLKNAAHVTNTSEDCNTFNGGVVGLIEQGNVQRCSNTGDIEYRSIGYNTWQACVGGVVGYLREANATGLCNFGNVRTLNASPGGAAGGVVGEVAHTYNTCGITNCFNMGDVTSNFNGEYYKNGTGGIVGNGGIVKNCYNTGNIISEHGTIDVIGISEGTYNSYYLEGIEILGETENPYMYEKDITMLSEDFMKSDEFVALLDSLYWSKDEENINRGFPINNQSIEYITNIQSIDDLVRFSNMVNIGYNYSNKTVYLDKSLDFEDDASYINPERTDLGDINEDGIVEGLKTELTKKSGKGFRPIGSSGEFSFYGNFDGQGNEIRNLYTNGQNRGGFFYNVCNSKIQNLGVTGTIKNNSTCGGIVASSRNCTIESCYFKGEIIVNNVRNIDIGGIVGYHSGGEIKNCYNSANIICENMDTYSNNIGGIAGEFYGTCIKNCYNTGNIYGSINKNDSIYVYAGGVIGSKGWGNILMENCYNIGSITIENSTGRRQDYAGGIIGTEIYNGINNCTYLNGNVTASNIVGNGSASEDLDNYMKTKEFYDELNVDEVWAYRKNNYPVLLKKVASNLVEGTEISIENSIKQFEITTEAEKIYGAKVGSIYGEGDNYFERVPYDQNNTKEIKITPNEGYEILKVTVNGRKLELDKNNFGEDGSYTIQPETFKNMKENKHIVVTFAGINQIIEINKIDKDDNTIKLENAKFKIDLEDIRTVPNVIGAKVDTGNFGFIEVNGKYISSNSYLSETVASSYVPIDLREIEGIYNLVINAEIESEYNCDFGYVIVTENAEVPSYSEENGRVMLISGFEPAKDYNIVLQGGKTYYIHFGYTKNWGMNDYSDTFRINNIKLELNGEEYTSSEVITDKNGQAKIRVPLYSKVTVTEIEPPAGYNIDSTPKEIEITPNSNNQLNILTFENERQKSVVVHHYLKGTNNRVAEDDILTGNVGETYTTSPRVNLEGLELEKNEEGRYVVPINATGLFSEGAQEVIYYYEPKQINLTIHHYKEGTENKLLDDEYILEDAEVQFDVEGNYKVSANGNYIVNDNLYRQYLIEDYNISKIVTSSGETLNVGDEFEFTENAELIYYYNSKEFKITTKVNSHKEEKYDEELNENVQVDVDGGEILGGEYTENYKEEDKIKYVQSVKKSENQTKVITIKPDEGYYIEEIKIISTDYYGNKETSIIYGENKDENTEIQVDSNINPEESLELPLLTNIGKDKQIEVSFKKLPVLIVRHYSKDSKGNYTSKRIKEDDETIIHEDFIGKQYQTEPMTEEEQKQYHVTIEKDDEGNVIIPEKAKGVYGLEDIVVTYYYVFEKYNYTIEHYYEDIDRLGNYIKEETIEATAEYGEKITINETDKHIKTGYKFEKIVLPYEGDILTISDNENNNVIKLYYKLEKQNKEFYNIKTAVIKHKENYKNGVVQENICGGTISGEAEDIYEQVPNGETNKKSVEIVPDNGYEISKILINGEKYTFSKDDFENGKLVIKPGTLGNIDEDKYIEVEFRKSSTITVKYMDEADNTEIANEEIITGFDGDGKEYSISEIRKAIPFYRTSNLGVTDEENNKIQDTEKLKIYADPYTVICWYKKVETEYTIIEKHIAITEKDKEKELKLDEGTILDERIIDGNQLFADDGSEEAKMANTSRKTSYKGYIAVDGPISENENIIIVGKDVNSKEIEIIQGKTIEVRYYYEKQFEITAKVKLNNNIAGGTVLPQKQNVLDLGINENEIEIKSESGYKVKSIYINGEKLIISNSEKLVIEGANTKEEEIIKLKQGYFKDIDKNIEIEVEFEKVPAKVIVKYIDIETNEEIVSEKIIKGYVNDNYSEDALEIEGYNLEKANEKNKQGKMTSKPIIIEFYYKKIKQNDGEEKTNDEQKENENGKEDKNNDNKPEDNSKEENNKTDENEKSVEQEIEKQINIQSNVSKSPKTGENITIYMNLFFIILCVNVVMFVIKVKFRK